MHYRRAVFCLANLDRVEEAGAALPRCAELRPDFIGKRRGWRPYNDDARNTRFFAGMRRHGLTGWACRGPLPDGASTARSK